MTINKRLLVLLPIVMLAGCADYYANQSQSNPAYKDHLRVENPSLYSEISLRDVKQQRSGDLLTLQLTVHHDNSLSDNFRYRIEWTDAAGIVLNNNNSPWVPITLGGNQDYVIQTTAPSAAAQNFHVIFAQQ